jgi:hypothetical protein
MSDQELVDLRSYRTLDEATAEELIELAPGETSLHFFQRIYRSIRQPMTRRMRAAEFALQHEHPKLGAIATASMNGQDFASLLEKAIARSQRGAEVKQIEARAEPTD